MRALRSALLVALCVSSTPGVSEIAIDAVHVVVEGLSAHADHHDGCDPEHPCTGWRHTCVCHVSVSIAPVTGVEVPAVSTHDAPFARPTTVRGPAGVRDTLDRPPRA